MPRAAVSLTFVSERDRELLLRTVLPCVLSLTVARLCVPPAGLPVLPSNRGGR